MSQKYDFPVNKELLTKLSNYRERKALWESFRDSFRASKDAETVPTGALEQLLLGGSSSKVERPKEASSHNTGEDESPAA
jgi:hypothetical protein